MTPDSLFMVAAVSIYNVQSDENITRFCIVVSSQETRSQWVHRLQESKEGKIWRAAQVLAEISALRRGLEQGATAMGLLLDLRKALTLLCGTRPLAMPRVSSVEAHVRYSFRKDQTPAFVLGA